MNVSETIMFEKKNVAETSYHYRQLHFEEKNVVTITTVSAKSPGLLTSILRINLLLYRGTKITVTYNM